VTELVRPTGSGDSIEHLLRELAPHVLGILARRFRDFAAAEDAFQEALLAAAMQWPRDGLPDGPRAWLAQVFVRPAPPLSFLQLRLPVQHHRDRRLSGLLHRSQEEKTLAIYRIVPGGATGLLSARQALRNLREIRATLT
jgi:hypothetical protein